MRAVLPCSVLLLAMTAAQAQRPVPDPAASQRRAGSQDAFPLRAIEIRGLQNFPPEQVQALTGLKIGQSVRQADFQDALQRLTASGVFESVEFRYGPLEGGYRATFTVHEVAELYPVRLKGFGIPEEQLRAQLAEQIPLFGEKVPPTGPMISRIGDALQKIWHEQGKDSKVLGRLSPTGEDQFEMLFQPETSIQTIAFVRFENSGVLSKLDLQRSFNQIAMGVPYSEVRLQELLHYNVRPLYEEKGRMDVQFCPCRAEPDPQSQGLLVDVQVEQGEEYTFGKLELPKNLPLEASEISRRLKITAGETANMTQVRTGLRAVEESLKREGFMKASGSFEKHLNAESKTVDLTIQFDLGDRYSFDQLKITGLDVITEPTVRKRWGLKVGDPFDAGYPPFFLDRVRGMLDNLAKTDWRMAIDEQRKTVDVELIFEGPQQEKAGRLGVKPPG